MSLRRSICSCVVLIALSASHLAADQLVPFRGYWVGSTVSATPLSDNVVLVVSSGTGNASELGRFEMTSPHLTYLDTLAVEGEQIFTAANGDSLIAQFSGQFVPVGGSLEAILECVISSGTGRFAGATGTYDFHIVAVPGPTGFDSTATIDGVISSVGSSR